VGIHIGTITSLKLLRIVSIHSRNGIPIPNDRIQITVTDDGRGIIDGDRAKPASLGIIGLEERILSVAGALHTH
jgi:glucose-6-phosphate-specific signal transduction histidine kinase